jgi:hypothetical protein
MTECAGCQAQQTLLEETRYLIRQQKLLIEALTYPRLSFRPLGGRLEIAAPTHEQRLRKVVDTAEAALSAASAEVHRLQCRDCLLPEALHDCSMAAQGHRDGEAAKEEPPGKVPG